MDLVHAGFATSSLVLGILQMWGPKYGLRHRWLGRSYFVTMALTALSSFTQTSMTGGYSYLHLLALLVLFTLAQNVWYLRRGNYVGHAFSMIWLFGGVVTAAVLATNRHTFDLSTPVLVVIIASVWFGIWRMSERFRQRMAVRFA